MKTQKQILKYIIEIIIIIVGVVIAFYLTQYGEKLNRNKNEKDVLKQIKFELEGNLLDLERDLVIHEIGLSSNLRVIKFMNREMPLSDSLIMDFYWMTRDEYIFANTSGYENLKSFGVNLIKDDSLRYMITMLYNSNFPRLSTGNTINPDINEFLTPFFSKHFRLNQDKNKKYLLTFNDSISITYPREVGLGVQQIIGYIPLDKEGLLRNEEFRFLINKSLEFRRYKQVQYRSCIYLTKMIIERIEGEI